MQYEPKRKLTPQSKETGWTVEEYYQLPEEENVRYELVNGRLELLSAPSTTHQRISHQLERVMTDACESAHIIIHAPVDVILGEVETRQPDILMVHRSRAYIIEERAVVGPPDLVVEILSPGTAKRDRTMKLESYARFGVPEYWIVDAANMTIEQYVQAEEGRPYSLANLFGREDKVFSERMPCIGFVVEEVLTLR